MNSLIELHLPDVVLSLGQSPKYAGLSIERVALNLMDSVKPDNDGHVPTNEPIHSDGDTAYMTFSSNIEERDVERVFTRKLSDAGLDLEVLTSDRERRGDDEKLS